MRQLLTYPVLLLLFFFLSPEQYCPAQSSFFRNYSVEDGLPFINVSTIFQDSKGNLWSGGYGGLSKFDGSNFTNYAPADGLLNHFVTCISEDNKGNIWIGTISGINKFDGSKFTGYTSKHGLIDNAISSVTKDKDGSLWFGTTKGISKLSEGTFINFSNKDGLISNHINCLFTDRSNKIWIGTPNGLSVFDGVKFTNYNTTQGFPANQVNAICQDKEGSMWIATNKGVCKLIKNQFNWFTAAEGIANNMVTSIHCDFKNNIWIGTEKGLTKYEKGVFTTYAIKRDQNSNLISCLLEDYEKNMWIGTYSGLFKYRGNPFICYGTADGLSDNFIFGILRDSNKNLWIGSQNGGLFKQENNSFKQYHSPTVRFKTVNVIYEFSKNNLWLGTDVGLVHFNGSSFSQQEDKSGIYRTPINCIYKDSQNNIWLGANGALFCYRDKKFRKYSLKTKNEGYMVWSILEDRKGILWFGTYLGGLIRYDGKTFEEYSAHIGSNNDSYLTSLMDDAGNLYFGTLNGLWIVPYEHAKKPVHVSQKNGLSSNLIYSLTFNKNKDQLWIGTNQGINCMSLKPFFTAKTIHIVPFGKQEGFTGVECNSNGSWVDDNTTMWFGTVYGLIKYTPSEYIPNVAESKISITGMRLFYKDTLLENNVKLAHNDNNISFNFNGISLTNPEKVHYSYLLEGFEKNWSPATNNRFATYSNLPPGNYTFNVISSNNEGIWNSHPASFSFTIKQPFWKTTWFITSIVLITFLTLTFSIRFRINTIKYREKRKTEFNKKIAQLESQALRAQMNPHFIFNTLSSIQHYISNNDTDAALKYLSKFAKLMRRIMDNSKLQLISVAEELNALDLYLELEVMRFDKKFDYKIIIDKEIDPNYDRIPSMLIQPYVENAIIHGLLPKGEKGKIVVELKRVGETISCTIEDNGIGREKAKEYKKNSVQQHKSMGMSITQERLAILNSSLKSNLNAEIVDLYENGHATGTKVHLIIPLESGKE